MTKYCQVCGSWMEMSEALVRQVEHLEYHGAVVRLVCLNCLEKDRLRKKIAVEVN